jgi:hypothetical protein
MAGFTVFVFLCDHLGVLLVQKCDRRPLQFAELLHGIDADNVGPLLHLGFGWVFGPVIAGTRQTN